MSRSNGAKAEERREKSSLSKRRRMEEHNENPARVDYYDVLRRHQDVEVAPMCNGTTSYQEASHVVRYSRGDESYRLLNIGVLLPFSTRGVLREQTFTADATSVMLAIHHFNTASREVLHHSRPESCDIRLTAEFFDTQASPIASGRLLNGDLHKRSLCNRDTVGVVLGPKRSSVAVSASVLANTKHIPVISHAATSSELDNQEFFPYFGRLVASSEAQATAAVAYLRQLGVAHVNFFSVQGHYGQAYWAAFSRLAMAAGIKVYSKSLPPDGAEPEAWNRITTHAAASRFRYTLAVIETMDQYESLMTSAHKNSVVGEDFVWLFADGIDFRLFKERANYLAGSALEIASRGVGFIKSCGGSKMLRRTEFDRFLQSLNDATENEDMLRYMESKLPLNGTSISLGGQAPMDESVTDPAFLYDSVISIGLAACKVTEEYFAGPDFFESFRHTNFTGVSGPVMLNKDSASRNPVTELFSVSFSVAETQMDGNVLFDVKTSSFYMDPQNVEGLMPSEYDVLGLNRVGTTGQMWLELSPFVYSGGGTSTPPPLPDKEVAIQGIDTPFLVIGLVLCGISLFIALCAAVWTWRHRKSRVVRKSQPIFLLMISVGAAVMSIALFPHGLQPPVPTKVLDVACMAGWWLYSFGFVIAFTALFAKTWRLNMIMRAKKFTRITVRPRDVYLPFAVFLSLNVIVLALWTAIAPLRFTTIYSISKDEFGRSEIEGVQSCVRSDHAVSGLFSGLVLGMNFLLLVFTTWQNGRASNVKAEYNETFYIGVALIIVLQTWLLGFPMVFVFHSTNPNVTFLALSLISSMTSAGMTLAIVLPKVRAVADSIAAKKKRKIEREERLQRQEFVRSIRLRQDEVCQSGPFTLPSQVKERRRSSNTTAFTILSSRRSSRNLHDLEDPHAIEEDEEGELALSDHHLSKKDLDALSVIESVNSASVCSSATPSRRGSIRGAKGRDSLVSRNGSIRTTELSKEFIREETHAQRRRSSFGSALFGSYNFDDFDDVDSENGDSAPSSSPKVRTISKASRSNDGDSEDRDPPSRRQSVVKNLTDVLFGTLEEDDVDPDSQRSEGRRLSLSVEDLHSFQTRYSVTSGEQGESSGLSMGSEGLKLTFLQPKKLINGPCDNDDDDDTKKADNRCPDSQLSFVALSPPARSRSRRKSFNPVSQTL